MLRILALIGLFVSLSCSASEQAAEGGGSPIEEVDHSVTDSSPPAPAEPIVPPEDVDPSITNPSPATPVEPVEPLEAGPPVEIPPAPVLPDKSVETSESLDAAGPPDPVKEKRVIDGLSNLRQHITSGQLDLALTTFFSIMQENLERSLSVRVCDEILTFATRAPYLLGFSTVFDAGINRIYHIGQYDHSLFPLCFVILLETARMVQGNVPIDITQGPTMDSVLLDMFYAIFVGTWDIPLPENTLNPLSYMLKTPFCSFKDANFFRALSKHREIFQGYAIKNHVNPDFFGHLYNGLLGPYFLGNYPQLLNEDVDKFRTVLVNSLLSPLGGFLNPGPDKPFSLRLLCKAFGYARTLLRGLEKGNWSKVNMMLKNLAEFIKFDPGVHKQCFIVGIDPIKFEATKVHPYTATLVKKMKFGALFTSCSTSGRSARQHLFETLLAMADLMSDKKAILRMVNSVFEHTQMSGFYIKDIFLASFRMLHECPEIDTANFPLAFTALLRSHISGYGVRNPVWSCIFIHLFENQFSMSLHPDKESPMRPFFDRYKSDLGSMASFRKAFEKHIKTLSVLLKPFECGSRVLHNYLQLAVDPFWKPPSTVHPDIFKLWSLCINCLPQRGGDINTAPLERILYYRAIVNFCAEFETGAFRHVDHFDEFVGTMPLTDQEQVKGIIDAVKPVPWVWTTPRILCLSAAVLFSAALSGMRFCSPDDVDGYMELL